MSKRNFPNFLDAYVGYARDNFCPEDFHLWTGISVVAGALERKVWVSQALATHYPNIYALLVSHPGVGKSTAIERGVELLEQLSKEVRHDFKIVPNQITEPALLDMMKILNSMQFPLPGGHTKLVHYSAGYFYASEASASALQNLFGDFNATITALYDCPKVFRKKLKSEHQPTEIPNACLNVLAGATFDYLKKLVNEESVMGGLASRFIYVICKERKIRTPKWDTQVKIDIETRRKLFEDLVEINKLTGPFQPTPGFIKLWEDWHPEFDKYLISLESPRMESLMARKATNLMKVSMILSVSEGDSLVLNEKHWEQAHQIIEDVTRDNAFVISSAVIADKSSQSGTSQLISQILKNAGGTTTMKLLRMKALANGNMVSSINETIDFMASSGWISIDTSTGNVKLLVDPDRYL